MPTAKHEFTTTDGRRLRLTGGDGGTWWQTEAAGTVYAVGNDGWPVYPDNTAVPGEPADVPPYNTADPFVSESERTLAATVETVPASRVLAGDVIVTPEGELERIGLVETHTDTRGRSSLILWSRFGGTHVAPGAFIDRLKLGGR